jgi:vacuolar-type H+-ATPase subunit F/Vma7
VIAPVHVVCRHPAAVGFALAGVSCIEAADGAAAAAAIGALRRGPAGGGVILIEDALADALPMALRRQLARDALPILMPFPAPALAVRARAPDEELLLLLRQAIGYRVRLR